MPGFRCRRRSRERPDHQAVHEGRLIINGDGQQYRSLVHVRDVARAIVAVLDAPRFMRDRQILHVGDERNNLTIKQIAELVKRHVRETQIIMRSEAATDRRDYRISCQRIRSLINWRTRYSVEDGVSEMIERFSRNHLMPEPQPVDA